MPPASRLPRILLITLITSLLAAGLYVAFFTSAGAELRHNPAAFHAHIRHWTAAHPVLASALVLMLYVIVTLSMMPVLWLPILAGAAFGLTHGVILCEIGATFGATVTFLASRYLAGQWFHARVESHLPKLRKLDDKLSHNGLLVVMVARLVHVLPFGPSYYMFGLTKMTAAEVAAGTLLGHLPTCMLLVRTGAGWHTGHNARFLFILLLTQGLLMLPLLLRYLWPRWFRKIGIE